MSAVLSLYLPMRFRGSCGFLWIISADSQLNVVATRAFRTMRSLSAELLSTWVSLTIQWFQMTELLVVSAADRSRAMFSLLLIHTVWPTLGEESDKSAWAVLPLVVALPHLQRSMDGH